MVISRTPHRISFFGGGTDFPNWYLNYGGKVIGASVDKYSYITCRYLPPFFNHKYRISYSKIEIANHITEILHPSVRESLKYTIEELKYFTHDTSFEIHHVGDIPARSGMGSSSSFTVGFLNALYALTGRLVTKKRLFTEAIHIEQNLIKESVGSQDQVWAACGGLNLITFEVNGEILVKPIIMQKQKIKSFEGKFLLFFTGISRFATDIESSKIQNIHNKKAELKTMLELVDEAYSIITSERDDFTDFGKLLNETWLLKKKLSDKVSNTEIDTLYKNAIKSGAVGGKLLGAGGGGFMLFYVEPEHHENVKAALSNYLNVPFNFDFSGSQIIVYRPNYND
ncbi:MAG: kinase [Nitrospirae bacterium]|nr:kinase [Nitrospirota bacterium]